MKAFLVLLFLSLSSCAATNGETFKQNLLDCVKANSEDMAAVQSAFLCMNDVLANQGSYVNCLSSIEPDIAWTTEEVICIANVYSATKGAK